MNNRIIYSDDVSILDHASFIVFKNFDGDIQAIKIYRFEDTEQFFIYDIELFNKPSDTFINEDQLNDINQVCSSEYKYNQVLTDVNKYGFSHELCLYFGADNFDSYPQEFLSFGSFEAFLKDMELI